MAEEDSGDGGGHEQDQQESGEAWLDSTFSRQGIWEVVIGFTITMFLVHFYGFLFIDQASHRLGWMAIWAGSFVLSILGGIAWPDIEDRLSEYLPWMP